MLLNFEDGYMANNQATNFDQALRKAQEDPLGAFICVVDAAPESASGRSGEFTGVPFAVKDNIDTVALPTTSNTPALTGSLRTANQEVVNRLLQAGALMVGKTNMHELAFGITTGAAANPATRNPFDASRSPGGSSGGSGAAVGSGIVPFALATDTGGSVSIPAAWCGVYGYRPTIGRWPQGGTAPLSATRDSLGVIAASYEYLQRVDGVVRDYGEGPNVSVPLRLGVPRKDSQYLNPLSEDIAQMWEKTIKKLEQAGETVELIEVETDHLHELDAACGIGIVLYETVRDLTQYLASLPTPVTFEQVMEQAAAEDVHGLLGVAWEGRDNHKHYEELMVKQRELQKAWDRLLVDHDLDGLIRPTTPISPTPIGDELTTEAFGQTVPTFATVVRNTGPGSTAAQPAVTIPVGVGAAGLPVGITIDGARNQDDALLITGAVVDELIGVPSPLLSKK